MEFGGVLRKKGNEGGEDDKGAVEYGKCGVRLDQIQSMQEVADAFTN